MTAKVDIKLFFLYSFGENTCQIQKYSRNNRLIHLYIITRSSTRACAPIHAVVHADIHATVHAAVPIQVHTAVHAGVYTRADTRKRM